MKLRSLEVLHCDAGWRPWTFVKATTEDGLVGWSEVTESGGSTAGVAAVIGELEARVRGRDPRRVERLRWELDAATRQSPGGIVAKAVAAIENALLDLKGKALGVPVHELFGGPVRDSVPAYWSHCGTSRVRAHQHVDRPQVRTRADVTALAREVAEAGFGALKTNILVLEDEPFDDVPFVYMPGTNRSRGGPDLAPDRRIVAALVRTLEAFQAGLPDDFELLVDLNFNFRPEGFARVLDATRELDLGWVEIDLYHPEGLAELRRASRAPICSGENLYGMREYLPYLTERAMDVCSIDVPWNGFGPSLKIAALADAQGMTVTPHNYYSHLATFMSAHLCAAVTNVRLLEVDVDDVPWKDEVATALPQIADGAMTIPAAPGWGCDIDEEALAAHPWPAA